MTKQEFSEKFDSAYRSATQAIDDSNLIAIVSDEFRDDDNNISLEGICKSTITASALITKMILKTVLEQLLPLDEQ